MNRTHEMFLTAQRFGIETTLELEKALECSRVVGMLDAWAETVDLCERGCRGHDEGRGETEYCDGSCRTPVSLRRHTPKLWWVEKDVTANGVTGYAVHTDEGDVFPIVTEGGPDAARAEAAEVIEAGEV